MTAVASETTRPSTAGSVPAVEALAVRKAFGASLALDGASLAVQQGELIAIMGPSGSGKSTLLHALAGIVPVDDGEVRAGGRDLGALSDADRSALRLREFGFVFQFGQLVPELTLLENVAMPLRLSGKGRKAAELQAMQWLERLGVDDVAGKPQSDVSGGQAQRTAIARALVHGPRVVFADEPTGALDSLSGERAMELLVTSVRDTRAALVLVTHDARVAAYADRTATVRDGRVIDPLASA